MEKKKSKLILLVNIFLFGSILTGGITLLILNLFYKEKVSNAFETLQHLNKDELQIVDGEFLILINKKNIKELDNIINPLNLRVKMPILNWILLQKNSIQEPKYLNINSKKAHESRLILMSLLKNQFILDAQHNFVLKESVHENASEQEFDSKVAFINKRPHQGAAQSFLTALDMADIDVCSQSIIVCPENAMVYRKLIKSNIIVMPFGSNASELLQFSSDMMSAFRAKNVTVISSAGSNGENAMNFFPGGAPGIINVGFVNKNGKRAALSNWGPDVDILGSLKSVAHAISLMKDIDPKLSNKKIEYILKSSANKLSCKEYCPNDNNEINNCTKTCCNNKNCSMGILNTKKAISLLKNKDFNVPLLETDKYYLFFSSRNMATKNITITNVGEKGSNVKIKSYGNELIIEPSEFYLGPLEQKNLNVSFMKEPIKRLTFKVEIIALGNNSDDIADISDFYVEYAPKR